MDIGGSFPFQATRASSSTQVTPDDTARYHETCSKYIESGFSRNVTIKFLMERLVGLGCEPPKGFISCIDCPVRAGGGFGVVEESILPQKSHESKGYQKYKEEAEERKNRVEKCGKGLTNFKELKDQIDAQDAGNAKLRLLPDIFLCQQHLVNQEHAHQSIVHELIHAIDLCRANMKPIDNCLHMACTEIRAENLSGECNLTQEMLKGKVGKFRGHGAECVKRRATLSVQANPKCSSNSRRYVDAAFDRCFRDTFPFDRHPNLR